jgi:ribosomal protein S18 acetylase RimI-like enzyme
MAYLLPEQRDCRLPRLFAALAVTQYLRHRAVELLIEDGRVLGAALWSPPGHWLQSGPRQLLSVPRFAWALGSRMAVAGEVMAVTMRHHPDAPHWYLGVIGTEPAVQGSVAGSALLRSRLDRCDRAGQPAYLESSNEANLPLYQRFGFEVTERFHVAPDGPPSWGMWREPR